MNAIEVFVVSSVVAIGGSAQVKPVTTKDVSPHSGYVPLRMDGYVNDQPTAEFPSSTIKVNGIPFHLTNRSDRNNLFLKKCWVARLGKGSFFFLCRLQHFTTRGPESHYFAPPGGRLHGNTSSSGFGR